MKAATPKSATPEQSSIHTPLTLDDRDAVDLLRHRMAWQAILVQHTLSTWDEGEDRCEDCDRPTLETGLIALCASIVADTDSLREVLDVAEKRRGAR